MGDTIIGVQFGIANPDEIVSRSVVEVITEKTYQGDQPVQGGVFDRRFGVIENGAICATCKHIVDDPMLYQNTDFWESQISFEE